MDGNQLATSSLGIVRLWDVGTGRLLGGWSGTTENFVRIGHSLFALTVGWLGGQLSCRLRRASSTPEVLTAVGVEGTNSVTDIYSRPGKVLHSFSRLYPDAWKQVDEFRAEKGTQGLAGMVLPAFGGNLRHRLEGEDPSG